MRYEAVGSSRWGTAERALLVLVAVVSTADALAGGYPIVDTNQRRCWDGRGTEIECPVAGQVFYGQDAQHIGRQPRYADNRDGTVSDLVTGLMWQQSPGPKLTWGEALAGASALQLAGYNDWRLPSIKELYSLIDFSGETGMSAAESTPYIDTGRFGFEYGDTSAGERFIDAQYCSATAYVWTTMNGDATIFGVNFADGRIKGYPASLVAGTLKTFFVVYVRGNPSYGANDLVDNGDGTITDRATGLMWSAADSGVGMVWEAALAWVEARNAQGHLGHADWRLPNAKELQSIVDYSRSPDTTGSAAIDPLFSATAIVNESGGMDFPFYWTSTTHRDGPPGSRGDHAVYVAFGRALGWMEQPPGSGRYTLLDVHGAGAQRSDPKSGSRADFPYGRGPQGDVVRIDNFVRLVRDDPAAAAPRSPRRVIRGS